MPDQALKTFTVSLHPPAREMAREEIAKQLAFLAPEIHRPRISPAGDRIDFEAPPTLGSALAARIHAHASRIERTLRSLTRKTIFRSAAADRPQFADLDLTGVHIVGRGQAALEGVPLRLFRYFDRIFEELGAQSQAQPLLAPSLIPSGVLARCGYFRSFPQHLTFASHLRQDSRAIDRFRARHETADGEASQEIDEDSRAALDPLGECLSPAACYHVYHLYRDQTIPRSGTVRAVCGKCYRFEAAGAPDLRRLWEFTMREVVFLGSRSAVLAVRDRSIEQVADLLNRLRLAGEIRTASDPFFVAPDAVAKTYFQLSSEAKYEISLLLPDGERLAAGSHNYHGDFFGRAFRTEIEDGGPMHSVCVAFGLERWVYSFLAQHGAAPHRWPDDLRSAPEFR